MALTALNQMAESTLNNISCGVQGWIQKSPITWISTAVAFHGVKLAREHNQTAIKESDAAKFVALACTTYTVMQGIFAERKELDIEKLPNRQWIAVINAAVLALYGAHRLGIALNPQYGLGLGITAASYGAVKVVYDYVVGPSGKSN